MDLQVLQDGKNMLDAYFHADSDQDDPSGQFGSEFFHAAETLATDKSGNRECERDQSDNQYRRNQGNEGIHIEKSQRNADS